MLFKTRNFEMLCEDRMVGLEGGQKYRLPLGLPDRCLKERACLSMDIFSQAGNRYLFYVVEGGHYFIKWSDVF